LDGGAEGAGSQVSPRAASGRRRTSTGGLQRRGDVSAAFRELARDRTSSSRTRSAGASRRALRPARRSRLPLDPVEQQSQQRPFRDSPPRAARICKPSDGLEPSTPSLPWLLNDRSGRRYSTVSPQFAR
jgi:hypothetical protein